MMNEIKAIQSTAIEVVGSVSSLLHSATKALASRCSTGGKLDISKLDAAQISCFELSWVAAEIAASSAAIRGGYADDIDRRLALVFTADAMASALQRLDRISLETGTDALQLGAVRASDSWCLLQRAGLGASALEEVGRAVAYEESNWGQVELPQHICMAVDNFRRFAADVVAPLAAEIHRRDLTVPAEIVDRLRDMGVFGLSVPEEYGGSSTDEVDGGMMMMAVTETLSEASLGAAGSLITRPEILGRALLAGGTKGQKEHWLPRIASGEVLCGIAITEPDHGSDVAGLSLRATPVEGGWRLNGTKTWCTFAGKAEVLMVVARTKPDRNLGHNGLSIFLVSKPSFEGHAFEFAQEQGGCLVGRSIPTIGYRGMHSFDLSFQDLFVPADCLLGESAGDGRGFYFTMAGMMGGRLQTAARACGLMRAGIGAAVNYATQRRVFGRELREYPLTQSKLALMAARLTACRRLAYEIALRGNDEEARMNASLVKLIACRSAELVSREALQLHGGMGYAEESAVSRYFVDARVLSIFEGAEETLALKVIARSMLEDKLRRSEK